MPGHRRLKPLSTSSSTSSMRAVAISTVSITSLLVSPVVEAAPSPAEATQPPANEIHLPGYGRLPNSNFKALLEGDSYSPNTQVSPLTPEQQSIADKSILNTLPLVPERAPQAGTLVSKETGRMMVDDRLWNTNTYRFHYNSTDSLGNPSVDTAIYVEPKTPWRGQGPRPIIALPPGTQGSGKHCDPSLSLQEGPSVRFDPFDVVLPYEAIPLAQHLARGAAVVMIDHHRNNSGNQDYTDNIVAAQSLLDAVDAASELGADPKAPVGIYGYSQGGSAAAAAAERAALYAPDINVVATAAGAPPSDLNQVLDKIHGSALTAAVALSVNSVLDKDPEAAHQYVRENERQWAECARHRRTILRGRTGGSLCLRNH